MWFNPDHMSDSNVIEPETKRCTLICDESLTTNNRMTHSNVGPPIYVNRYLSQAKCDIFVNRKLPQIIKDVELIWMNVN